MQPRIIEQRTSGRRPFQVESRSIGVLLAAALLLILTSLGCAGGGGGTGDSTGSGGGSTGGTTGGGTTVSPGTVVVFDFDTATTVPTVGSSLPLTQSKGGLSADFSDAVIANGYSVQNGASTQYILSRFSGNYLMPNSLFPGPLTIQFSQAIRQISITFATADFNQAETPTTVLLTAYLGAASVTSLGSVQGHGTYSTDTMPMGALSFDSGGAPFDRVVISIPPQTLGSSDCLIDNISVTVH